jgi:transposase
MQAVKTIGLDIAKSVFQVHGVDAQGEVHPPSAQAPLRPGVLPEVAIVPGGHRGLRVIPPLVT